MFPHSGGADDSGSDSGSDIFAYADFAPAGSDDPAPEYSEIGSPADAAKQRYATGESHLKYLVYGL